MREHAILLALLAASACAPASPNHRNTDWSVYLGDSGRRHYSPLDEITRDNVDQLEVAWTYDSGEPQGTMLTSPLVVRGVLYGLSPQLDAFALDAATGEALWRFEPDDVGGAQRGLMWWEGAGGPRLFYTAGRQLLAVDPTDGTPVAGFGKDGRLDLTPPGDHEGSLTVTVPGVVFRDMLILGFSTSESADAFPGAIRAFSAIDGSLVWQFDTIPAPGTAGSETWAEGSLAHAGGANVWTGMALDAERALLFAPTGSATPDFYGGKRLGDNLYANSLVALNAHTGELRWHYQVFRHDLWDRDNPSPPTLVHLEREGETIDAVTLTTKSGHLYAFDRDTGEPLYPITQVGTLPSTLPGEVPAATQPVSSVAFSRQTFEVTNRTPEARAHVEAEIEGWDVRPWAPPRVGTVLLQPWYDGGAEWGGSAFDPATNALVVNANDVPGILTLSEVPAGTSDYGTYAQHCGSCHGLELEGTGTAPALRGITDRMERDEIRAVMDAGSGRMPSFAHFDDAQRRAVLRYLSSDEPAPDEPTDELSYVLGGYVNLRDHEELPGNTPPWGTLNSIDLATGDITWSVPFGNYPSHPDLGYGAVNYGGPVVTASGLIFIAATPDKLIRAIDTRDGRTLWDAELPAAGFSTPAVYSVDGKQYVVIAAGGGRLGPPSGSEYVAFSLPR
ncbi:MAG: PQQ-binding-like beta-propeller repeat protein [Acidobacteria bacterium]|nr:PQQ-binding-like beta-propeller repeat protein [Acidobacteriota bacterium]